MNQKDKESLEALATQLTGIEPITNYEYQRLTYSKTKKGIAKKDRKELFKASKRII